MGHGRASRARRGATAAGPRWIGAALAAVLVAVACFAGSAAASNAFPGTQHNPRGKFLGVVPSSAASGARPLSAVGHPPLLYHHGPVEHSSRVYSILWDPPGYSFPPNYGSDIQRYFKGVAADSGRRTNVYASDTQYYDVVNGHQRFIAYHVTSGGAINDTAPLPPNGCHNYRLSNGPFTRACLTDAQQVAEINRVVTSRGLPRGIGVEYFLFMPQRLGSCFDASGRTGCYDTGYCAYHSQIGTGANVTLYSSMPFAKTLGCDPDGTPHGTAADSVLNVTSHEHNETITDPTGGGWYDAWGYENGDECSFDFGVTRYNGLGYYNQVINGGQYLLQQEWSNAANRCVQT